VTGEWDWLWWVLPRVAVAAILILWIWQKGRPFAAGAGFAPAAGPRQTHLFPNPGADHGDERRAIYAPVIGAAGGTIHMAHISSVRIETGASFRTC